MSPAARVSWPAWRRDTGRRAARRWRARRSVRHAAMFTVGLFGAVGSVCSPQRRRTARCCRARAGQAWRSRSCWVVAGPLTRLPPQRARRDRAVLGAVSPATPMPAVAACWPALGCASDFWSRLSRRSSRWRSCWLSSQRARRPTSRPARPPLVAAALLALVFGISQLQNGCTPARSFRSGRRRRRVAFRRARAHTPDRRWTCASSARAGSTPLSPRSDVQLPDRGRDPVRVLSRHGARVTGGSRLLSFRHRAAGVRGNGIRTAAARFGDRAVLVTGLLLLLAGLLMLTCSTDTSLLFLRRVALNAVGGAVVQTPRRRS